METGIRVLAVDDEDYMLKILKVCLSEPTFRLTTCSDAMAAMSVFKKGEYDLVILDVLMPGIDGFELHSLIRQINKTIPIIMLTARLDDADGTMIRRISSDKNTYYQGKGFKRDELVSKIKNIVAELKSQESRRSYFAEMERDITLAGEVQRAMFPHWSTIRDGFRSSFFFRPYMKITGDIFSMTPLSKNVFLAVIGDISGHGIQAALTMSAIQFTLANLIRVHEKEAITPHMVLNQLQRFLVNVVEDRYMTCTIAVVDFNANRVTYQSAGHADFLLYSPSKGSFLEVNPEQKGALPVGLVRENTYNPEDNVSLEFPPDSIFFFSTDGVSDLQNSAGEDYGRNPLEEFVEAFAKNGLEAATTFCVVDALFKLGFDQVKDDMAIAAFARYQERPGIYDFSIRPMLPDVDEAAVKICGLVEKHTGDATLAGKIELLAAEFLNNVVVHGLGNKNMPRPVISARIEFTQKRMTLSFWDRGKAWDMRTEGMGSDTHIDMLNQRLATSGRGIPIIKKLTSSISRQRYVDALNETIFTVECS